MKENALRITATESPSDQGYQKLIIQQPMAQNKTCRNDDP